MSRHSHAPCRSDGEHCDRLRQGDRLGQGQSCACCHPDCDGSRRSRSRSTDWARGPPPNASLRSTSAPAANPSRIGQTRSMRGLPTASGYVVVDRLRVPQIGRSSTAVFSALKRGMSAGSNERGMPDLVDAGRPCRSPCAQPRTASSAARTARSPAAWNMHRHALLVPLRYVLSPSRQDRTAAGPCAGALGCPA